MLKLEKVERNSGKLFSYLQWNCCRIHWQKRSKSNSEKRAKSQTEHSWPESLFHHSLHRKRNKGKMNFWSLCCWSRLFALRWQWRGWNGQNWWTRLCNYPQSGRKSNNLFLSFERYYQTAVWAHKWKWYFEKASLNESLKSNCPPVECLDHNWCKL